MSLTLDGSSHPFPSIKEPKMVMFFKLTTENHDVFQNL